MTESPSEFVSGTWAPTQCPFRVAYSLRTLDDIRLAVVDAFFSVPHGGVEIGGILLGRREGLQTTILDSVPLDCEHAFGPSFTLSPKDLARLTALLEEAQKNASGLQPVGWYHSHTRSGVFLSEADLEIHQRYFPSPWQVALVLKPHTFQPTRAGIFFREVDGSIHATASYLEFALDPAPLPSDPPAPVASTPEPEVAAAPPSTPEPPTPPPPVREPEPQPEPVQRPPAIEPSLRFLDLDPPRRWPVKPILGIAACLAIGAVGFETRQTWLPGLEGIWPRADAAPRKFPLAAALGLTLADREGDLSITWNHKAAAVAAATTGTLEISADGGVPMKTPLDAAQLHSGSLTFRRETEKVDVTLSVEGPQGQLGLQSLSYMGKLPDSAAAETASPATRQRDALAAEVQRLKSEIQAQTARNRDLQGALEEHAATAADFARLKAQLNAQIARSRDLDKTAKAKDDQIAKLRNDLTVQQSHAKVLAKSVDDLQLRLQQVKRLNNQNADPPKP
jgi:proteasome lid subunit RPN8/RPN11